MKGLLFKPAVFKLLTLFSLQPGRKLTRKEIKEYTKQNNVPLDGALRLLEAIGLLVKERRKYRFNFEKGEEVIELVRKEHARFNKIPLNAYFALLDIAEKLSREKCDMYLFGSYAKGNFTSDSDLDVAVVTKDKPDLKFVRKLEKKHKLKIHIHLFDKEFYRHKSDRFVKEVLDGLVVFKNL